MPAAKAAQPAVKAEPIRAEKLSGASSTLESL